MIRKWVAMILAGLVLCTGCVAEGQTIDSKTAHEVVTCLFAAAAGTNADREKELFSRMTEEEETAHIAENAAYRKSVLPWLAEVLIYQEETGKQVTDDETPEENEKDTDPEVMAEMALQKGRMEAAFRAMSNNEEGRKYLDQLYLLGAEDEETCLELTRSCFQVWLSEIEPQRLRAMNEDYLFWLYAPDSPIDYPVVQGTDNAYYLHRLFDGEINSAGTLFADYRNLPTLEDPNTLVYGHHMRNDSMFGSLDWYEKQEYYESHPYMLLVGEDEIDLIELFAGYTTKSDDECYDIAISDEKDLLEFTETAKRKSDFISDTEIMKNDRLITLSTCAYAFQNARYIVIGRLLPTWRRI